MQKNARFVHEHFSVYSNSLQLRSFIYKSFKQRLAFQLEG